MINQLLKSSFFSSLLFIGLTSLLMSAACDRTKKPPKEEAQTEVLFQLSGQFLIHQPHCGGRAPREDKLKQATPYRNKQFVVKKGASNQEDTTVVASFSTDEEGKFSIQLPKGSYCLLKADKNQAYADFYGEKQSPTGQYYQAKEEECFKDWWTKCELTLVLEADTLLPTLKLYNRCFTGENSCMQYTGPLPP
jgi:hypothetical protein